ncbi:hypothetical protein [Alteromonas sp. KUL106]|uniref:hypothetical protein n=1 Tax=Alteromonas sp. KUL106 TaxID=2480799 RepID=UPI00135994DA|nr:hypothetical protein [Alteromonas sp. KUL106]
MAKHTLNVAVFLHPQASDYEHFKSRLVGNYLCGLVLLARIGITSECSSAI